MIIVREELVETKLPEHLEHTSPYTMKDAAMVGAAAFAFLLHQQNGNYFERPNGFGVAPSLVFPGREVWRGNHFLSILNPTRDGTRPRITVMVNNRQTSNVVNNVFVACLPLGAKDPAALAERPGELYFREAGAIYRPGLGDPKSERSYLEQLPRIADILRVVTPVGQLALR